VRRVLAYFVRGCVAPRRAQKANMGVTIPCAGVLFVAPARAARASSASASGSAAPPRRRRAAPRAVHARGRRAGASGASQGASSAADGGGGDAGPPKGPAVDDWITRWKARRETGDDAPPARSPAEALSGPDPRTAFRYVFAGGLSPESCGFSALILRDALEPRGVKLNVTQLAPPDGQSWTLRCGARGAARTRRVRGEGARLARDAETLMRACTRARAPRLALVCRPARAAARWRASRLPSRRCRATSRCA
jgi:hypothetical protein